jgi:molybdate transport system ATP-binding protein
MEPRMSDATLEVAIALQRGETSVDVQFTVAPGVTVLFGPSGAGKSTVLDVVAGLVRPARGSIRRGAETWFDVEKRVDVPTRSRRVGYALQSLALFPHRSVWANVTYGVHANDAAAMRLLDRLEIGSMRDRAIASLSGGERQRVALARALANEPRTLLLDEPLGALDRARRGAAVAFLREWIRERGIPAIWVTHDHEEAEAVGDRLVRIEHGRVVAAGAPMEVLEESIAWGPHALGPNDNRVAGIVERAGGADLETVFRAGEITLHARPSALRHGDHGTFVLRASDVTLALDPPGRTSAGNVLEATVVSVTRQARAVIVTLDAKIPLHAEITPAAAERLALTPGATVWALFKTRACFVVK